MTSRRNAPALCRLFATCVATLASIIAHGQPAGAAERDPVRNDPPPMLQPPASMAPIIIPSHGSRLNGLIYLAGGAGPHPVAVFLHGYPGNEKNLDLAQAVRRAGYHALYVDYRGTWGSGGTFSLARGLEDAAAVLDWVRAPANTAAYHLDPARIALIGHSFGGWLALMTARGEPPTVCVAALAAWNVGWRAGRLETRLDERAELLQDLRNTMDPAGGPVRADPLALLEEMQASAATWDYLTGAHDLRRHTLLLVAATRDSPDEDVAMHASLAQAIRAAGGQLVQTLMYEDDHSFSSHRVALADALVQWLRNDCAAAQASPPGSATP